MPGPANGARGPATEPLVSVILTTRDRPRFLPLALGCYAHQTYANRELVVVDDGTVWPADRARIEAAQGKLITVKPGTPIGVKLNIGIRQATGRLCMKMDDDDWYGPLYVEAMAGDYIASQKIACQPMIQFLLGFLFFDLNRWELRRSIEYNVPGATLFFGRDDWQNRPFRPLSTDEDLWFLRDQVAAGAVAVPSQALENFVAVRHRGHAGTRGHTWARQLDGQPLEDYLVERPLYKSPEEMFPEWAVNAYRQIRSELQPDGNSAPDRVSA